LNWSSLNEKISQNKSADYSARLRSALGSSARFIQADLSSKGNIHFRGDANTGVLVACVVEINK
jgi:hypothetical protein